MDNFLKITHIHIIGIGGIGISAIARLLLSQGKLVSGSDLNETDITRSLKEAGARIIIGKHDMANVPADTELIVYSDAVPEHNPERQLTKTIPGLSYFQFLGEYSKNKKTIAISGAHGKTTTTALTGLIFEAGGLDPTVIVGTKMAAFGGNLRIGGSDLFIVEADEYRAHMLELRPHTIILNNIEADHLDYYKTLDAIIKTFQTYLDRLPKDGLLIYNADDPIVEKKITLPGVQTLSYSTLRTDTDLYATEIEMTPGVVSFDVFYKGKKLDRFSLQIPGMYNISNALGALAAAIHAGINPEIIKTTVHGYSGSWRRFEKVGKTKSGSLVISDYAHHPTEVKKTLEAVRSFFPAHNILVVFQPHQLDRTRQFFSDFVDALSAVPINQLIVQEIYEVAGREDGTGHISSQDLVREINSALHAEKNQAMYTKNGEESIKRIGEMEMPDSVIVVMGAGDIDAVARTLVD